MTRIPTPLTRAAAVFGLALATALPAAQAQFTLSAEVRPRAELRDGFKTPSSEGFEPAFFVEQRSRLYADYAAPKYSFRFALQDIRLWGQTPQIFKEELGVAFLSEAWGEFDLGATPTHRLRVGRQILSYDNQRFLGGLEWAQQGRRHDAAVYKYQPAGKGLKLHVAAAFNADDAVPEPRYLQGEAANFYSTPGNYKSLQFAWLNKTFGGGAGSVSVLALNATLQNADTTVSNKQTLGLIPRYKLKNGIALAADLYYQTGELGGNDVGAYLLGANATFPTKVTPLTVGFELISGKDDADGTSDITNFSPDYGTNHAFNGLMDYFFVGPANGNVGVNDFYAKSKFSLGEGALLAHVHHFLTGSEQLDAEGQALDKSMGTELDLVYTRAIAGGVRLHLGYSHLRATETMLALRPGNRVGNNWAWAMVTFKPVLFKQEPDVEEPELRDVEAVQPRLNKPAQETLNKPVVPAGGKG